MCVGVYVCVVYNIFFCSFLPFTDVDCSGSMNPGLNAIMGPSGSGKTS